ncbi:uncharacterized protein BJ212DRAFT_1477199 [Suillus subaureus]|uniref:Uncharacterized protein n=1 Tax=Suillus subaureus TaxID=48587 RepID=A0A9P7EJJ1_9AGAM|nr:uncharacterized protein BJ212DRAFT_1477199 [Suillus subaureus]KAG1822786.1 hypothetical protein BJ212DRAFT_1477199 [Suillus subaureus]
MSSRHTGMDQQAFWKHAVKAMVTASDDTDSDLVKMLPLQAVPSTLLSSPSCALIPLSNSESFPPSLAKQPPTISIAILPKPVLVAHKKANPVPRPKPVPKAKPVPKTWSNTCSSAHLSAGAIQVEEPMNKAGDTAIVDVNAPTPPKKKPMPCHSKKAA